MISLYKLWSITRCARACSINAERIILSDELIRFAILVFPAIKAISSINGTAVVILPYSNT